MINSFREFEAGGYKAFANTGGGSYGIFIGYEEQIVLKAVAAENLTRL